MSIELHIFMHDSRVPSREAWQLAIDEMNFPTVLDAAWMKIVMVGFEALAFLALLRFLISMIRRRTTRVAGAA